MNIEIDCYIPKIEDIESPLDYMKEEFKKSEPYYNATYSVIHMFNISPEMTNGINLQTISEQIKSVILWLSLIDHYDTNISRIMSLIEVLEIQITYSISEKTQTMSEDPKNKVLYKPSTLKAYIDSSCAELTGKRLLIQVLKSKWSGLLNSYRRKAKDLQSHIHNLKTLSNLILKDSSIESYLELSNNNLNNREDMVSSCIKTHTETLLSDLEISGKDLSYIDTILETKTVDKLNKKDSENLFGMFNT